MDTEDAPGAADVAIRVSSVEAVLIIQVYGKLEGVGGRVAPF